MKRIKDIINALKVISDTPSKALAGAALRVMADAQSNTGTAHTATAEDKILITKILAAVVGSAEDMEKAAKSE